MHGARPNGRQPAWSKSRIPDRLSPPVARATFVVLLNTDINHNGAESGTLFGEAITKIVSPGHVFNLPAQPAVC
ncbi:hypothetical protein OK006_9553 [Actinobacteria bacterium OK006]|nr:hypothetical protein OK006_9553 [Actinobacteria bacterium OK006]